MLPIEAGVRRLKYVSMLKMASFMYSFILLYAVRVRVSFKGSKSHILDPWFRMPRCPDLGLLKLPALADCPCRQLLLLPGILGLILRRGLNIKR
jgi:hypothetical protein